MSRGRGGAYGAAIAVLAVMYLLAQAKAATFVVGDSGGWTFNVENWPNGKAFKAGDTLVFNYDSSSHDVEVVDYAGYTDCQALANAKVHSSGNDRIKLVHGTNYFICGLEGHCEGGMKIAVNAAWESERSSRLLITSYMHLLFSHIVC